MTTDVFFKFCNITDLVAASHQTLLCRLRPWHLQTTASAGQVWWSQWGKSWSAAFPTSAGRTGIRLWLAPASVTWSRVQPKLLLGSINSRCLPGLCEAEGLFFCPLLVAQPGSTLLLPLFSKVNWIFVLLLLLNDHQLSNQYLFIIQKERPLTLRLSCWNHLTRSGVWISTALKQTLPIFSFLLLGECLEFFPPFLIVSLLFWMEHLKMKSSICLMLPFASFSSGPKPAGGTALLKVLHLNLPRSSLTFITWMKLWEASGNSSYLVCSETHRGLGTCVDVSQ